MEIEVLTQGEGIELKDESHTQLLYFSPDISAGEHLLICAT